MYYIHTPNDLDWTEQLQIHGLLKELQDRLMWISPRASNHHHHQYHHHQHHLYNNIAHGTICVLPLSQDSSTVATGSSSDAKAAYFSASSQASAPGEGGGGGEGAT